MILSCIAVRPSVLDTVKHNEASKDGLSSAVLKSNNIRRITWHKLCRNVHLRIYVEFYCLFKFHYFVVTLNILSVRR